MPKASHFALVCCPVLVAAVVLIYEVGDQLDDDGYWWLDVGYLVCTVHARSIHSAGAESTQSRTATRERCLPHVRTPSWFRSARPGIEGEF